MSNPSQYSRSRVFVTGLSLILLASYSTSCEGHGTRPNILVILLDDVGWGDIDIAGVTHDTPALTPHLKEMSLSDGAVSFNRFYIGGSTCSPTRATCITGRTPTRDCVISTEQNALPSLLNMTTTAAFAKRANYATGFFGKWHLGSFSDDITSSLCYAAQSYLDCTTGYIFDSRAGKGYCCDGRDASCANCHTVPVATPVDFGFDTVLSTSQVASTSQANCGCVHTVENGGVDCELGHYKGSLDQDWLECDNYFATESVFPHRNSTGSPVVIDGTTPKATSLSPVQFVTPVDDAAFLMDHLMNFIASSVNEDKPFYAQLSFHQSHIPYIAPPAFRTLYSNLTLNEADYFGSLTAADAQIGRLRKFLRDLDIADDTFILFTSDNGPEVDDTGGHSTSAFPNPGSTGGLVGRKRAMTEGGIRVPGVVEFPRLIKKNMVEMKYAASTLDILPTLTDLIGQGEKVVDPVGFEIDGTSLLPYLQGKVSERVKHFGVLSDRPWKIRAPEVAFDNVTDCISRAVHDAPPSFNKTSFSTPFDQNQLAWVEGDLKLFMCSFLTAASVTEWRFSLYNVAQDPQERQDLFGDLGGTVGDGMLQRAMAWMESLKYSVREESKCTLGPKMVRNDVEARYENFNVKRGVFRNTAGRKVEDVIA